MENMVAVKFCYRLVASSIICATFLKNKLGELFDRIDEEKSTEDEDFGKIQSSLGKESVPLLMSGNQKPNGYSPVFGAKVWFTLANLMMLAITYYNNLGKLA